MAEWTQHNWARLQWNPVLLSTLFKAHNEVILLSRKKHCSWLLCHHPLNYVVLVMAQRAKACYLHLCEVLIPAIEWASVSEVAHWLFHLTSCAPCAGQQGNEQCIPVLFVLSLTVVAAAAAAAICCQFDLLCWTWLTDACLLLLLLLWLWSYQLLWWLLASVHTLRDTAHCSRFLPHQAKRNNNPIPHLARPSFESCCCTVHKIKLPVLNN